jgi:DNA replication licensing factor MCM7
VTLSGIFLPQPLTGFRAMRAGLLTTTYLEAMSITQDKRSYAEAAQDTSLAEQIEASSSPIRLGIPMKTYFEHSSVFSWMQ